MESLPAGTKRDDVKNNAFLWRGRRGEAARRDFCVGCVGEPGQTRSKDHGAESSKHWENRNHQKQSRLDGPARKMPDNVTAPAAGAAPGVVTCRRTLFKHKTETKSSFDSTF